MKTLEGAGPCRGGRGWCKIRLGQENNGMGQRMSKSSGGQLPIRPTRRVQKGGGGGGNFLWGAAPERGGGWVGRIY